MSTIQRKASFVSILLVRTAHDFPPRLRGGGFCVFFMSPILDYKQVDLASASHYNMPHCFQFTMINLSYTAVS